MLSLVPGYEANNANDSNLIIIVAIHYNTMGDFSVVENLKLGKMIT